MFEDVHSSPFHILHAIREKEWYCPDTAIQLCLETRHVPNGLSHRDLKWVSASCIILKTAESDPSYLGGVLIPRIRVRIFQDLMPGSPKFSKDFDGKAYSNVLEVFCICLEVPNDSEKYFDFVVDECTY